LTQLLGALALRGAIEQVETAGAIGRALAIGMRNDPHRNHPSQAGAHRHMEEDR
jgi:hypothetical protein